MQVDRSLSHKAKFLEAQNMKNKEFNNWRGMIHEIVVAGALERIKLQERIGIKEGIRSPYFVCLFLIA